VNSIPRDREGNSKAMLWMLYASFVGFHCCVYDMFWCTPLVTICEQLLGTVHLTVCADASIGITIRSQVIWKVFTDRLQQCLYGEIVTNCICTLQKRSITSTRPGETTTCSKDKAQRQRHQEYRPRHHTAKRSSQLPKLSEDTLQKIVFTGNITL
jgi:hypothetical protein